MIESTEVLYEHALQKMNADQLIVQLDYKIENYQVAAAMFEQAGEYLDAPELAQKCRELAKEAAREKKRKSYQKATALLNSGNGPQDWEKARGIFESLGEYKESPQQVKKCEKKLQASRNKKRVKKAAVLFLLLILLLGCAAGWKVGLHRYLLGLAYAYQGEYEKALLRFEKAEPLLDSEKRAEECRAAVEEELERKEKTALKKASVGSTVSFGNEKWLVWKEEEDKLWLILSEVRKDGPFYQVPYHETQEDVRWEESTLNKWLNDTILFSEFSESDRQLLLPVSKDKESGEYLRILSAEEALEGKAVLGGMTNMDYWLSTPGEHASTAAFVSVGGTVVSYGCPVDTALSVRPVICVDRSGL